MRIPRLPEAISYEVPIHPDDENSISLRDTFADESVDLEAGLRAEEQRARIREALKRMKQQERITVFLRAAGWTLEQIGQRMGVSRERVRQWERDARLVAHGKPRYQCTEKYQASENKRRQARRKRYTDDERYRQNERKRIARLAQRRNGA